MRLIAIIMAGVALLAGCSKEEGTLSDVQPDQKSHTTEKDNTTSKENSDQTSSKFNRAVKVKYEVKADGPIGNGKFKIEDQTKTFCGGEEFTFSFETREKQELLLEAFSRNNRVNSLKLRVYIDGQLIEETEAKSRDLFTKGSIQQELDQEKIQDIQ